MIAGGIWILILVLAADCALDVKQREIFPCLTVLCVVFGLVVRVFSVSLLSAAVSLLPGGAFYALSAASRERIGKGDALMVFAAGSWTGARAAFLGSVAGVFLAAAFALVWWMIRRKNSQLPFAPFLAAGLIVVLCCT